MKRLLLLTVLLSLLISCGGKRQTEKALYSGNYDQAITNALQKLKNNKKAKRKEQFIGMMQEAYYKVVDRDLEAINRFKKDGNPELYKTIFETYSNLDARQEAIKPVLPLYINRKNISFNFNDYTNDLVEYKYKVSDYLADKGLDLLDSNNKYNAREAYDIFKYVNRINPNFENVNELMLEAREKGIDHVLVSIENQTHQIIPVRLENDLLDFNTYGLKQFWTVYHSEKNPNLPYDYSMQLQLRRINISPERVVERQILREREIVDGWEYKLDRHGNVMKDSLGNDIKIDKIINARCRLFEFEQTKSTQIIANVVYNHIPSNQVLDEFPIDSEFIFNHIYARARGDKRALTSEDLQLLENRRIHFPTDAQMIYDTGEDLKFKLKDIINSYRVRE